MTAGGHCRVMVAGHRIAMQSMMVCGIDRATTCMTEVVATAVIVASSAYHMPGMTATIGGIEGWTSKEEVVAVRVACIYGKVPETVTPVEWAIEVGGCAEGFPLPVQQDIAQVQVTMLPIGPQHIVTACYTHQIVEVDFVCSLILFVSQVQFVSHLVCQEEGFVACLIVAHCLARCCYRQQCYQGHYLLHHNRIFFNVQQSVLSFLAAKIDRLLGIRKGFPLNSLGEIPNSY